MTLFATRALRILAVVAIACGAGVVTSTPALAHAELISTSPEDGAVLAESPDAVVLTYAEPVTPEGSGIVVTGPDGKRYDLANTLMVGGTEASVELKPATAAGLYNVSYRIVAEDGHVGSGTLTYTVGDGSASDATPSPVPATSDGGGSTVWVLGAGAIGIVLIIAVIAVFTRGRRD